MGNPKEDRGRLFSRRTAIRLIAGGAVVGGYSAYSYGVMQTAQLIDRTGAIFQSAREREAQEQKFKPLFNTASVLLSSEFDQHVHTLAEQIVNASDERFGKLTRFTPQTEQGAQQQRTDVLLPSGDKNIDALNGIIPDIFSYHVDRNTENGDMLPTYNRIHFYVNTDKALRPNTQRPTDTASLALFTLGISQWRDMAKEIAKNIPQDVKEFSDPNSGMLEMRGDYDAATGVPLFYLKFTKSGEVDIIQHQNIAIIPFTSDLVDAFSRHAS